MQFQTCRWLVLLCVYLDLRCSAIIFGLGTFFDNSPNNFHVYWNVPTFLCHRYGMDFQEVRTKFGIVQNERDKFKGEEFVIMYDPGYFPALLTDDKGNVVRRNGGLPQEGNFTLHLDYFRQHLQEQIPNSNFSGLAVIDFESWRPVFRQNWSPLQIYRDLSIELERNRHPFWSSRAQTREATARFEKFGRLYMQKTLEMAKSLRPNAEWGYYAYPYCFNWSPNQWEGDCDPKVHDDNDKMSWLFDKSDLLLPSVYLHKKLTPKQRVALSKGRIEEAVRVSRGSKNSQNIRVLPYFWYKYHDSREEFLEKKDVIDAVNEIIKHSTDGLIVWGSSRDVDNKQKCENLRNYLHQTLGPIILRAQRLRNS